MAETSKDQPKEQGKESGSFTMADLRKLVTETVTEAVKTVSSTGNKADDTVDDAHNAAQRHTESRLDRSSTVAEAVQREIEKIKRKEERDAKDKSIDEQLAKLTEATAEKPPVERRRVHRFMGWGEPAK